MDYPELLGQVESGVIKIPDFQRRVVWDVDQTLFLLDSISRGFPIGSFILWNTQDRMRSHRSVGDLPLKEPPEGRAVSYVLDGQQRLTSLFACLRGAVIGRKKYQVFCDLDATGDSDVFSLKQADPARFIDVKDILGDNPHLVYDGLTTDRKKRFNELREAFRLYKFSVIRIEDQPLDTVCEIFTRINNTGTELDLFDLMVAKTWSGDFNLRDRYSELISDFEGVQYEALGTSVIMQAASAIIKHGCTRDLTLQIGREELASVWPDVERAIRLAVDHLRDGIGVPSAKLLPYPSAIVPLAYFFSRNNFHQPDAAQSGLLKRYFWRSAALGRYTQGTESKLGQDLREIDRLLSRELNVFLYQDEGVVDLHQDLLIRTELSVGNSFSKMVLAFLAANRPLNLENNAPVRVDNSSLARSNSRHFHHFFPKRHLAGKGVQEDLANSVINICLVPAESNLHYQHHAPKDYLAPIRQANANLLTALRSHFIEDDAKFGIVDDNYQRFLEARADWIRIELESLALTPQEFDDLHGAENEEFPSDSND